MDDIAALGFAVNSQPLATATNELDRISAAAKRAENASIGMSGATNEASDRLRKLGQATAAIDGPLGGVASRFRSLATLIRQTSLSTVVMTLGLGAAVLAIKSFALGFVDVWSDLNARIGLAINNMQGSGVVLERLATVARRTYSALDLTAESFIRNSTVLKELGKNTTQQLDYTEALNLALVVSGAKADRAAQVQEALGRAMAVGKLRGVELNTVIQTGGRVAEILAEELGVGVNSLRRMGEQGKITGDLIYNALTKRMETLRDEAEKMPATIGDAMMIMRNSLLQAIGAFDQNNKLSETFATAIITIADNLSVLVKAVLGLAAVFSGRVVAAFGASIAEAFKFYAAVASGNAVLIGSATANEMRARATMESAVADRAAAMAKVQDTQATVTQLTQTLALAQAQRASAAEAVEQARAAAQMTLSTEATTAALKEQHVATRAVIAARRALAAAEMELAAAKANSATASSTAAKASVSGAIQATTATVAATVAENAHAAALARTTLAARVAGIAMRGFQSALAFFGGPIGLAFTAIAIGIGYWATRTSEASQALETHRGIVEKIKEAYERAGKATADWAAGIAKGTLTQATASLKSLEQQLQSIRETARAPVDAFGRDKSGTVEGLTKAVALFREGTTSAAEFKQAVDNIAQSDPKLDRGIALSLLEIADNASAAEERVKAAQAAIRAIGGAMTEDDKRLLGIAPSPHRNNAEDDDAEKVRKAFEQQLLSARQRVELAELELKITGQSATEQERARNAVEIRQGLEAEALRVYGDRNKWDKAHYDALVAEANKLTEVNAKLKAQQALRDLQFDRSQMSRTPIEQAVYSRMQSLGMLTDGKIVGAYAQMVSAEIRVNEELQRSIDLQKEFTGTFLHGILSGKSALESLGDALDNLGQKILDNSLNTLFAGLGQAGAVPSKGIFGGNIIPGILHAGGVAGSGSYPTRSVSPLLFAGAPRYHNGGVAGLKPDEVPAILQRGERILSRSQVAGGGQSSPQRLDVHVSLDNEMLRAVVVDESGRLVAASENRMTATMPNTIVGVVRQARNDRKI